MNIEWVKTKDIIPNTENPRIIKDDKFKKLVQSIKDFPEMLEIRPIVVNNEMMILGGNMRWKAIQEIGIKEVPIIKAENLTEEQQREFLIKDNVGFGEWDWDALANDWNPEELNEWGLDVPLMLDSVEPDDLTEESKNNPPMIKITLESVEQLQQAEIDIQELIDRKYPKAFFSVSAGEI
jgi:ParB-like chromosome segregation protein Spo0J